MARSFDDGERAALSTFAARFGEDAQPFHYDARAALGDAMTTNLLRRRALAYGPYLETGRLVQIGPGEPWRETASTIVLTPRGRAAIASEDERPRAVRVTEPTFP